MGAVVRDPDVLGEAQLVAAREALPEGLVLAILGFSKKGEYLGTGEDSTGLRGSARPPRTPLRDP